jgi:hypothetical protein
MASFRLEGLASLFQCCGSMTFWCGSGCGSESCQQKTNLKKKFSCILLFEGTFTSFFKDKSQKEVTKQWKSRFSLLYLLNDRRIRIQEAQKHVDPDPDSDPDPHHWFVHLPVQSMQNMGNSRGRAVYEANLPDDFR